MDEKELFSDLNVPIANQPVEKRESFGRLTEKRDNQDDANKIEVAMTSNDLV